METKYEVIPIFSNPLYVNEIPKELVQNHVAYLDNEELAGEKDNIPVKEFGLRSQNTYILNKPEYKNLGDYILQHSSNFATNYMRYGYENYKFSQSWVSVKLPNEEHISHFHPNSLISGVLFYGDYVDNTSHITFHRDDAYNKSLSSHSMLSPTSPFNFSTFDIFYKPNLLVLFPSYLHHSVSKNVTNIPRKSLAFNIVPKDGFGTEDNLTKLKFN